MLLAKKKINHRGFTLIELTVSIFIIGMISSVFLANYRGTSKKNELVLAAQKMASDIRLAQNYSLSTKDFSTGVAVPGGWGVRASSTAMNNNHYVLFADRDSSKTFNSDEFYSKINLPAGVTISNIKVGGANQATVNIVFAPPDPLTYISNSSTTDALITLADASGNTKAVSVNFLGLVDVN